MSLDASKIHSHVAGRNARPLVLTAEDAANFGQLEILGINIGSAAVVRDMAIALDAAPDLSGLTGVASMGAPAQFLQTWLPGFVGLMTAARKIDELVGITTVGNWEDAEIIQGQIEPTGLAQPYGDRTPVPLASWNVNYERRGVARFEQGMNVGRLEEIRTAKMKVNTAAQKRGAAGLALDILRNRVGFYGYNGGTGRIYGFLNDPGLPGYVNVANPGAGMGWANKTFLQISADIREAAGALQSQSQDNINPRSMATTLAIPTISDTYLTVTSDFGISVEDWVKKTYPQMRIVSAPELNGANGGANVFMLYAESVNDSLSDDGGQVFMQMVPTKFLTLGVEKRSKDYVEDYSNALAGVMVKRPYAVIRRSGI